MSQQKVNVVYLGLFLGITAAVAAGVLSGVDQMTKEQRQIQKQKKVTEALTKVLPAFDKIACEVISGKEGDAKVVKVQSKENKGQLDKLSSRVQFYCAVDKDGKLVGIAGQAFTPKGYGGKLYAMVGMDPDGKVRTVIITDQNETPGLGTVVTDRKRQKTIFDLLGMGKKVDENALPPNPVLDSYDGHAAAPGDSWKTPWKVKKDGGQADFVTGATISSRAVCDVVYDIAARYEADKAELTKLVKEAGK